MKELVSGLFGKPKSHRITKPFSYVEIIDPRITGLKAGLLISSPEIKETAGDEFLQKYLHQVNRQHISKSSINEWSRICSIRASTYFETIKMRSNIEDLFGTMVHGFAMAVCEYESFQISKPELMSDCALDAMKMLSMQETAKGNTFTHEQSLFALLSGYHIAREVLKNNTGE